MSAITNPSPSQLDQNQILQRVMNESKDALRIQSMAGALVPDYYDYIALTYVTSGNGIGEIQTATYKTGGSGGTTVATLTLTYNADDKLETVTRS